MPHRREILRPQRSRPQNDDVMYMASGDAGLKDPAVRLNLNSKPARLPDTRHRDANGAEGGRYGCDTKERFFGREGRGLRMTA
jgi:hypothetical protein